MGIADWTNLPLIHSVLQTIDFVDIRRHSIEISARNKKLSFVLNSKGKVKDKMKMFTGIFLQFELLEVEGFLPTTSFESKEVFDAGIDHAGPS